MRRVIVVCEKPVDTFLLSLLAVVCSLVVCGVRGECPSDVSSQAYRCYSVYITQRQNMQNSDRKLCCGVDVEYLRAFCSSYMKVGHCLQQLKDRCPADKHAQIDQTRQNLQGVEKGLTDLCSDDQIYERYAPHQNCFAMQGHHSEECLTRYMNTSIRLMSSVTRTSQDVLCRDMRNALNCMKPNIKRNCGSEAAKLVEILVKPMVRKSSECDYHVIQIESTEKPQAHMPGHTPSSMNDNNKYITDNGNGATSRVTSQTLQAAMLILCVILMQSGW